MAGIALSGLASGIDTESLITQLLGAESKPRAKMTLQQAAAEQRVTTLQGLQTKLSALKLATTTLRSVTNWTPVQTAETSDTSALAAAWKGGAAAGSYSVQTLSLASSAQRTFAYTPPAADETLNFGTTAIDIAAGASLDDVVGAINSAGGGVIAVNAQGKLVVSSATTGAASTFTATGSSLSETSSRVGVDASYSVDGGPVITSPTNTIANGIPGVDLTLKKVGVAGVNVSVPTVDSEAMIGKIKSFIEAYNAVVDASRSAINEQPVKGATNAADARKGSLHGDQGLVRMLSSLRNGIGASVDGLGGALNQLSALGISTGKSTGAASSADQLAGKLTFDEAQFKTALTSNPNAVRELLGAKSGVPGFSQGFESLLAPLTTSGSGFSSRIEQGNAEISRVKASLVRFDDRLSKREDTLRKQFSAMETALSANQARQSQFASQLAQLTGS